jgi:hypothetical protein
MQEHNMREAGIDIIIELGSWSRDQMLRVCIAVASF